MRPHYRSHAHAVDCFFNFKILIMLGKQQMHNATAVFPTGMIYIFSENFEYRKFLKYKVYNKMKNFICKV